METMLSGTEEKSYKSNLISLGFQDVNDPTSISFYFKDFESKENFLAFLDDYNDYVNDEGYVFTYGLIHYGCDNADRWLVRSA